MPLPLPLVRVSLYVSPARFTRCVCVAHHVCVSVGCIRQPRACPSERTVSVLLVWLVRLLASCVRYTRPRPHSCAFFVYICHFDHVYAVASSITVVVCAHACRTVTRPFVLVCVHACVWPTRVASSVQPAIYCLLLGFTHKHTVTDVQPIRLFRRR